jgi:hypothetical protein
VRNRVSCFRGFIIFLRAWTGAGFADGVAEMLTVRELNSQYPEWHAFSLHHGRIARGFQFQAQDKRLLPTGYYGATSATRNPARRVIALHITNAHLDLRPLMLKFAEHFRLHYAFFHSAGGGVISTYSDWVLLTRDQIVMNEVATSVEQNTSQPRANLPLWTDQYSNLLSVAKR